MHRLRCDRQTPCTSCRRKGDTSSCIYSTNLATGPRSSNGGHDRNRDGTRASEAQQRLQKLEQMVAQLAHSNQSSGTVESSGPESLKRRERSLQEQEQYQEQDRSGYLESDGLRTMYRGATHWASILENVRLTRWTCLVVWD